MSTNSLHYVLSVKTKTNNFGRLIGHHTVILPFNFALYGCQNFCFSQEFPTIGQGTISTAFKCSSVQSCVNEIILVGAGVVKATRFTS